MREVQVAYGDVFRISTLINLRVYLEFTKGKGQRAHNIPLLTEMRKILNDRAVVLRLAECGRVKRAVG